MSDDETDRASDGPAFRRPATGPATPQLCERCWFPIRAGETARRVPVHVAGTTFTARLVAFVHTSPGCEPQEAEAA